MFAECVQLFLLQFSVLGFADFVKSESPSFLQPFVAPLFNETRTSGARDSSPAFIEKGGARRVAPSARLRQGLREGLSLSEASPAN